MYRRRPAGCRREAGGAGEGLRVDGAFSRLRGPSCAGKYALPGESRDPALASEWLSGALAFA